MIDIYGRPQQCGRLGPRPSTEGPRVNPLLMLAQGAIIASGKQVNPFRKKRYWNTFLSLVHVLNITRWMEKSVADMEEGRQLRPVFIRSS